MMFRAERKRARMAGNGAVARFSIVPPGPPVPSELFSGGSAGAATAFH